MLISWIGSRFFMVVRLTDDLPVSHASGQRIKTGALYPQPISKIQNELS